MTVFSLLVLLTAACPQPMPPTIDGTSAAGVEKTETGHPSGFPIDVPWIVSVPRPAVAQAALAPTLSRLDGAGRLLDGIQNRLSAALGVSPTSRLLWVGSGIASDAPIYIAARGPAEETLLSVGVNDTNRFLNALRGALGKNVAIGPRLGAVYSLVNGATVEALLFAKQGRVVVWFAPNDPLAAAALLENAANQGEHPLQNAAIDDELSKARAEVADPNAREILSVVGGVRSALQLSGTWASLLIPKPFTQAAVVLVATSKGLAAFGSAAFAPQDRAAISDRLTGQSPPKEACGLSDGAALVATFPVGAGLDQALAEDAPLPSADRLKGGAALALFPHGNRNAAASTGNSVLQVGSWAFVAQPKDNASTQALRETVRAGGMREQTTGGVRVFVAAPPDGNPTKTLQTALFDDALILGLGAPSVFDRTLAHRAKKSHRANCAKKFGAASLTIDGDHLMRLAQNSPSSAFSRVALNLASSIDRAAVRVWATNDGVRAGATLFPRDRPE